MNVFKIKVTLKGEATDNIKKIQSSLKLRALIAEVQKHYNIVLKKINDTSCEFDLEVTDGSASKNSIGEFLSLHISNSDFDVSVDEAATAASDDFLKKIRKAKEEAEKKEDSASETKSEEKKESDTKKADGEEDSLSSDFEKKLRKYFGKDTKEEPKEARDIMTEIRALIGAEHFKQKAEDLVKVAPKLSKLKNYFSATKFLFSIDDGNGLTKTSTLLAELLHSLGLTDSPKIAELSPIPYHEDGEKLEPYKREYKTFFQINGSYGIWVVDITKVYSHIGREHYREFFKEIFGNESCPIVVFRVPYLDEQARASVEEVLSDQFLLHSVPFTPLSMDELYTYACKIAEKFGFEFTENADEALANVFAKEKSDGKFYGFRTVDKVVRNIIYNKVKNDCDSITITAEDIINDDELFFESQGKSGEEQLAMLYGLEDVVKQINDTVGFIEYAKKNNPELAPSFHMKFVGNPGTGKTTVARILGKILKDRGILRTGVFFEYNGNDFAGKYVGHSAPKTAQMCRDAYGGVMFIDEAYALSPGKEDGGSFKREALNTLLAEMENHRNDMIIIFAGYEDELDELMRQNPGLDQRVPYTIRFNNYSKETLANIFISMASKKFNYEKEFVDTVKKYFEELPNNIYYSPSFANARYVRNLFERTISKAVMRSRLEKKEVATLTCPDFLKAADELKAMSTASSVFGKDKSGATMFSEERAKVKFSDVCGQEEAKEMLAEIVDYLKNPDKFKAIGARVPKGALLYGPPGTGKTMLAKAVAGEAKVPVLTISGNDFISGYVGKGAESVASLFGKARKISPCIIFIDEIDSIGTSRDSGSQSEVLMQLLTEMDGFNDDKTIIVLAATNRPDALDPALRRPGRFDREIPVELPDLEGRIAILSYYLNSTAHVDGIDLRAIGSLTSGFSGAELRNIVNEAAHRAIREKRTEITQLDLAESVEVVAVGYIKKNKILSEKEKLIVCYHEIGHALLAALQTHTAPVKKITVVPRTGGTLGYVLNVDDEQKSLLTKTEMENRIAVSVAGRAAEQLHFGEITTGASNDISKATAVARAIVATYGMTDEFGMVCFEQHSNSYLGNSSRMNCSDATARLIDQKVVEIVKKQYDKAIKLLSENKKLLDELASFIFDKETITGEQFMEIFHKYYA